MEASANTPLLPQAHGGKHDHPVFLRIAHSSWRFLPQNVMVYIRGLMIAYQIVVAILIAIWKLGETSQYGPGRILFDFGIISYAVFLLYSWCAFCWTFTHLYYPDIDDDKTGWEYKILRAMSVPKQMGSQRNEFYCSFLFMLSMVWPFLSTAIYWLDSWDTYEAGDGVPTLAGGRGRGRARPYIPPFNELFGSGWMAAFGRINLYMVIAAFAFLELFFFSSVKRPTRTMGMHAFGLMLCSAIYLGWAAVGALLTGWYPFPWLSIEEMGSVEAVILYGLGFIFLTLLILVLVQGFLAVRESIQRGNSERRAEAAAAATRDQDD